MSKRSKIIYIEDNDANLDLVQRVLHATGNYEVIGVMDGEAGLALIARDYPVLVLLDLDIPGLNGFEVLRQIKASDDPRVAAIPVAVVTANVITHERDQAFDGGCDAFIEKPFDIKSFRKQIRELVEGARAPK